MNLPIYERGEDGKLSRVPSWNNFIKHAKDQSIGSKAHDILKEEYNSILVIAESGPSKDFLRFETEQDMMLFLLKWS